MRFCSSAYRLCFPDGGTSLSLSGYSSYQARKVARTGYPGFLMTDAGLRSYLTNSSTARSLSSLEYIFASKSIRFGTGFRQHPRSGMAPSRFLVEALRGFRGCSRRRIPSSCGVCPNGASVVGYNLSDLLEIDLAAGLRSRLIGGHEVLRLHLAACRRQS